MPFAARRFVILLCGTTELKLADQGLLSPEIEKKVLGETDSSKRRPGDVTIPIWTGDKGLTIDVAVTCPLRTILHARPRVSTMRNTIRQVSGCVRGKWISVRSHGF